MAEDAVKGERGAKAKPAPESPKPSPSARRQIPGNLPYLPAHGTLKKMLEKIIELAKPEKFNADFLENVAKMRGGTARSCIPILKKMQFLNSDGHPTELYAKFRTDSGRSYATYEGLRNAFPEIFKRSDYAYNVDVTKVRDIIVEITGLKSDDPVTKAIKGTFLAIRSFVGPDFNHADGIPSEVDAVETFADEATGSSTASAQSVSGGFGINYNINIVVPETTDLNVLNAIFRSVRENLLK